MFHIFVVVFFCFSFVNCAPLPTTVVDNKKYTSEIEVGNEEVVFYYDPKQAPMKTNFEIITPVNGSYRVKFDGESGSFKSCSGGFCEQDITLKKKCEFTLPCSSGSDCVKPYKYLCQYSDQPDGKWRFILTLQCTATPCQKEVNFYLTLERNPIVGYGWMLVDITIYTSILLVVDIIALMYCLCFIFLVVCCFLPVIMIGCIFDRDAAGVIIGLISICCGIPLLVLLIICIVVPNFGLFFMIWIIVVFILSCIYWTQYCC